MPTLSNPELAEALEGANSLILRWGHNQMRQLKAEEVERIVAALKASASSETGPSADKDREEMARQLRHVAHNIRSRQRLALGHTEAGICERAAEVLASSSCAATVDWGYLRSVLAQGAAIQQDYAAGKFSGYEEYAARIDAAAREREDELKGAPLPESEARLGSAKMPDFDSLAAPSTPQPGAPTCKCAPHEFCEVCTPAGWKKQLTPSASAEPVAYLKTWDEGGNTRQRADLVPGNEPWLDALKPTVTPLGPLSSTTALTLGDPMDNWLMKPALEWLEQAEHGPNKDRCKIIADLLRDLWRRQKPITEVAPVSATEARDGT